MSYCYDLCIVNEETELGRGEMMSISWYSYCKRSKFSLHNQKHNWQVRSVYLVVFRLCLGKINIIRHMGVNLDTGTLREDLIILNTIHYSGFLMSGITSLLIFQLQYLSQCLVLSRYLINVCWMNACFRLLYPTMVSGWFCDFIPVDVLYARATFHMLKSIFSPSYKKKKSPFLSFVTPYITIQSIVYI